MSQKNGTTPIVHLPTLADQLGLPQDERTQRAITLVEQGKVTILSGHNASVRSSSRNTVAYATEGALCPCEEAEHHADINGCSHIRAVRLQRAMNTAPIINETWGETPERPYAVDQRIPGSQQPLEPQMAQNGAQTLESTHQHQPTWRDQIAPAIHTVKWQDRATGIEHTAVLRADTWEELRAEIREVVAIAKAHREVEPAPATETVEPPSTTQQTTSNNPGFCEIHGEWMLERDGNYFHKVGDKPNGKALWCKGV